MEIVRLMANHLENPLGFDTSRVLLTWCVENARGSWQTASRVQLATAPDEAFLAEDTGLVPTLQDKETGRIISGMDNLGWEMPWALEPRTRYYWRVYVETDAGDHCWSDWAWLETAKAPGEKWAGGFIASPMGPDVHPVFIRDFAVDKPLKSARMYCLGLGEYEAYLDGVKLGDEVLLPGLHTYDGYLQYQTFEVEAAPGAHQLAFLLGDGWYKGRYGLKASAPRYGTDYALIAEIHLCYEDGTEEIIATDESWRVRRSPVTFDGIYDGETVDFRVLEDEQEQAAIPSPLGTELLVPRVSPFIRVQEKRKPQRLPGTEPIYDFGQNMVGWVEFECDAPAGTVVKLQFAEILQNGKLYRDNLRKAEATFTYISDGKKRRVRPHFTFFGFRYMSMEGWTANTADITGCVIYSDMLRTGWIETANEKVNRLFANSVWSQKGNFLDVPTDCPQRDERMGWTGDIQVFSDTALYNMDCNAFLRKFLRDLRWDQQLLGGNVPCVTPTTHYYVSGVTGWGDAACVVPWQMYMHSGDKAVLAESLQSMMGWVDWITGETEIDGSGRLWNMSPQLGDWLALDGNSVYGGTDRGLIATAYYYYSAYITARSAQILGEDAIAEKYTKLAEEIRDAFRAEYFTPSGRLAVETQTACAVCSFLGLTPEHAQDRVAALLRRKVNEAGVRLETGFLGTPWLMSELTRGGSVDLAYGLLLREEYPGWLNEVNWGATTIWERWNSIEPDGSMNKDGMNSFNHYAYGCVSAWMYRTVGGIKPTETAPGFRMIDCAPMPDRRLPWAKVRHLTGSGLCSVDWAWKGDDVDMHVCVPFGCVMRLTMPDGSGEKLLTCGQYDFTVTMPAVEPSGLAAPWRELLENPETRAAVAETFPRAIRGVAFQYEMYTMDQVTQSPFAELTRDDVRRIDEAIKAAQRKQ